MGTKRCAIAWAVLAVAAVLPAEAQIPSEVGEAIGRAIAAGVVLGSDGFVAHGSFDYDHDDTTLKIFGLGYMHPFSERGNWRLSAGVSIDRLEVDENLDLGATAPGGSSFQVKGLTLSAGAQRNFARGWFARLTGAVNHSWIDHELDYPDAQTEATLAPLYDGLVFNWEAKAWTLIGDLSAGWGSTSKRGVGLGVHGELVRIHTDPFDTDDPIQDVSIDSGFERLAAEIRVPLGITLGRRPMRFDATVRHTLLDHDLAQPIDSDELSDVRFALIALKPHGSKSWVPGIGFAVTYTHTDGFDGWTYGVALAK